MPALFRLKDAVPSAIRERGERYVSQGRVGPLSVAGDGWIIASVRGSSEYEVEIVAADGTLEYLCSCPYFEQEGELCKHVWGVIRKAIEGGMLRESEIRRIEPSFDDFDEFEEGFPPSLPEAPRPANVYTFPPRRRQDWKDRLDQLRLPPAPRTASFLPGDQIVYVLVGLGAGSIVLDPRKRSLRKDGKPGVPRRFRPTHAEVATIDEPDREILALLFAASSTPEWGSDLGVTIRGEARRILLPKIAATGRLYVDRHEGLAGPVEFAEGGPWKLALALVHEPARNVWRLGGELRRDGESIPLDSVDAAGPGLFLSDARLGLVEPEEAGPWVESLRRAPIEVLDRDRDEFVAAVLERAPVPIAMPERVAKPVERPEAQPFLRLELGNDREGEGWIGQFGVRYGEVEVTPGEGARSVVADERIVIRDLAREAEFRKQLEALRVTRDYFGKWRIRTAQAGAILQSLAASGWEVALHGKPLRLADEVDLEVESGIDWFDLRAVVRFGEVTVPVSELLEGGAGSLRKLPDGSYGMLDASLLEGLEFLEGVEADKKGRVRFRGVQALLIDQLLRARENVRADRGFTDLRARIAAAGAAHERRESADFAGELRPYQRQGLGWLHHLRELEVGGCLADDMGLGKTVQVLALLASIRSDRPSLVVAPRSLLFNWKEEAARFAPSLRVVEHHGTARDRSADAFAGADLVLTTYGTLRSDAHHLAAVEFEYVVLDEAQAIKTASSLTARCARLLRGRHRLALSGTPIENHLGELWSLFEFLNPGMLGTSKWFRRQFGGRVVPRERLEALGEALRPLLLRRTKEQVAPELPPRVEQTLWCELEEPQRKIYEELRRSYRAELLERVRTEGMQRTRMHVLEALLRLRQAACDPALLDPSTRIPGAKLAALLEELGEVIESGHRALVFSQFTSFLRLAAKKLEKQKIAYAWLDGSTVDRQSVVRRFQSPDGPPVFLISLKAGGTGLNLTSADYVFLLDPWWNPAVEAQAIDRTHRIGQDKPVFAYRILARDTVEEKILELQASKRELADSILTEDNSVLRQLDLETLERLLS